MHCQSCNATDVVVKKSTTSDDLICMTCHTANNPDKMPKPHRIEFHVKSVNKFGFYEDGSAKIVAPISQVTRNLLESGVGNLTELNDYHTFNPGTSFQFKADHDNGGSSVSLCIDKCIASVMYENGSGLFVAEVPREEYDRMKNDFGDTPLEMNPYATSEHEFTVDFEPENIPARSYSR